MQTKAAVLYGKSKLKIETFDLPSITADELLVKVISNSICLSTYKAALLGEDHKRVPSDISEHPVMTGHECAGIIVAVGDHLQHQFSVGQYFVLQPAMGLPSGYSAGYSYPYFGGNATYSIITKQAIDLGCVLPYSGHYFGEASLAEPMSCIIGAYNASYHTTPYVYQHKMGIEPNGKLALIGCAGPMGIGAIDYAIHNEKIRPSLIVVTDIDEQRLKRAQQLIPEEQALKKGIQLVYINTALLDDPISELKSLTGDTGYNDVFVFVANASAIEQADAILGHDGCLNFFAGPTDTQFKVPLNFYHVHYSTTHIVGTSGGSTGDMLESLALSAQKKINPSYMITHIGGLDAVPDTILNLPYIPGGKKLIYPHIELPLIAIADFEKRQNENQLFYDLAQIMKASHNVWNEQAEKCLLEFFHVDLIN